MNPTIALWLILGIALMSTAAMAPLTVAYHAELARARRSLDNYAAIAATTVLLSLASLALWWYFAIATGQLLLGVIPAVTAAAWGAVVQVITRRSKATTTPEPTP